MASAPCAQRIAGASRGRWLLHGQRHFAAEVAAGAHALAPPSPPPRALGEDRPRALALGSGAARVDEGLALQTVVERHAAAAGRASRKTWPCRPSLSGHY